LRIDLMLISGKPEISARLPTRMQCERDFAHPTAKAWMPAFAGMTRQRAYDIAGPVPS
jgi:hypothetical protein